MQKKTILAISDFGTSGIAQSIREPLKHWHNSGHIIHHLALGFNGICSTVDESLYPWRERLMPIHPGSDATKFGQLQIKTALAIAKPDIILTSFDVWMVDWLLRPDSAPFLDDETRKLLSHQNRTFAHILYYPIDGLQSGRHLPLGMEESILGAEYPITYSNFSANAMKTNFNIEVPMIPISHDPKVYRPLDKKECRRKMHIDENAYVISQIGTNQYRKCFGDWIEGITPFVKAHDNVLFCPFTTNAMIMGGTDIQAAIYKAGIQDRMINPEQLVGRLSDEGMNIFYNCLDVLCLVSVGEGAGLPPLMARACGIPALVSNNTSNIEFSGHPFELLKIRGSYYDNFGSNLERYLTDTDDLTNKLEILYNDPALRHEIGQAGLAHMKKFEVDKIMPLWDEVLNSIPTREEEKSQ